MPRRTTARVLTRALPHAVLLPAALMTALPIIWLVCATLKDSSSWARDLFLPTNNGFWDIAWERLTLSGYERLLGLGGYQPLGFARALLNSIFFSSFVAITSAFLCSACGYALAHFRFRGQRLVFSMVLIALIIPAPMLIAPQYELLYRAGLLDTYTGLFLPLLAPAFGVYLFRQAALRSIPTQLLEAARLDGSGEVRILLTIAMPLMRPMLGAYILLAFMATWNNYLTPQVILQSPEKLPLAVFIANLRSTMYQDFGLVMVATLVSVLPIGVVFVLMQREFVSGLTEGAIRE